MNRFPFRLLLLALAAAVFPFFIRRRPRVERRVTICAHPASIFPFLEDPENWWLWLDFPCEEGECEIRIVQAELDSRIDYEAILEEGPALRGRIELQRDGACTRITMRCVWDLAESPYLRYLDLWRRFTLSAEFATGLARLKSLVEKSS